MDENTKKKSQIVAVLKRFKKNKAAVVGAVVFACIVLIAIFADFIVPYDKALEQNLLNDLEGPSKTHWFGTDDLGRDVFARVIHGTRYSVTIGIIVTLVAGSVGTILGAISGYFGGKVDFVIMRICDVFMSIPYMLFCITLIVSIGLGMKSMLVAMCTALSPGYARLVRASVLSIKGVEYVEASLACGCGTTRILLRHIIPNVIGPIIVKATSGMAGVILGAASLSFIGLGIQQPTPEWGAMMANARECMRVAPHVIMAPGVFILATTLSLNMMGDGLRDALDPRLKN